MGGGAARCRWVDGAEREVAEAETGAAAAGVTAGDEGVRGDEEEAGEGEGEGAEAGARAGGKFSVPSEPYRYFKFKPGQTGKPVLLLIYSTGRDPAGICNRLTLLQLPVEEVGVWWLLPSDAGSRAAQALASATLINVNR